MKTKSEISIHKTRHPLFMEGLETVQCFDSSPGTPNTAAAMSLVFDITRETESQKRLGNWLASYIEPFLLNPVRDEQNLPEKTLAIATYIFIASRVDLDYKLADEYLINYIEYASNQSWFGEHFLAFYCHYLKDQLVACEGVDQYFSKSYEKVLSKKHIPAISQSLIVLHGSLTDLDAKRGIDLLTSLLKESNNISHIAWGLWAFSIHNQPLDNLVDLLQDSITTAFASVRKDSGVLGLLVLATMGGRPAQLHEYLKGQSKFQGADKVKITLTEDYFRVDLRSIANVGGGFEHFSIFSLCIGLVGLKNSKREEISYISGLDSRSLAKISDRLNRLSSSGGVDLSRIEKNLLNVLVVVIILILIGMIFYFQIGGGLSFDISNVGLSKLTWEEIVITVSLIDYLFGTFEAARTNGNALEGLLKLPILRHWQSYQEKRNKQL